MRHKLLGDCAGILHTHLQPRNTTSTKALISVVNGNGREVLLPYGHLPKQQCKSMADSCQCMTKTPTTL